MYHRIALETFDPWGLAVAPDRFADQLAWLAKHRTLLQLDEFATLLRNGKLPDDAAAITFDDGYACTAEVAVPLLERHAAPATVFLPAGLIGRAGQFWWDELAEIVLNHSTRNVQVCDRWVDLGERQDRDLMWPRDNRKRTPRQKSFYALWTELQPLSVKQIERALGELRTQHPQTAKSETHRLMTVAEVRSISSGKVQFGSHALTHASLPGLSSADKSREIREGIAACEELTGARPATFAYPFGDFDSECEARVAEAGFACACTVERRVVAADDDLFALPRVKVGNWTGRQLRQALAELSYEYERA